MSTQLLSSSARNGWIIHPYHHVINHHPRSRSKYHHSIVLCHMKPSGWFRTEFRLGVKNYFVLWKICLFLRIWMVQYPWFLVLLKGPLFASFRGHRSISYLKRTNLSQNSINPVLGTKTWTIHSTVIDTYSNNQDKPRNRLFIVPLYNIHISPTGSFIANSWQGLFQRKNHDTIST